MSMEFLILNLRPPFSLQANILPSNVQKEYKAVALFNSTSLLISWWRDLVKSSVMNTLEEFPLSFLSDIAMLL